MTETVVREGPFQLSLPLFEGPPDDLLRLVNTGKISPEDVPVAAVAEQFLSYLGTAESVDLDEVGDFVAASARMLLLKSARALAEPVADEPDETLERRGPSPVIERLRVAALELGTVQGNEAHTPLMRPELVQRRIEPRSPSTLSRIWTEMLARGEREAARVPVPAFVRLETAISAFIRRLKSAHHTSLREVLRGKGRREAVVHFLAILELVRRRQAEAVQDELFGDIVVARVDDAADTASQAG